MSSPDRLPTAARALAGLEQLDVESSEQIERALTLFLDDLLRVCVKHSTELGHGYINFGEGLALSVDITTTLAERTATAREPNAPAAFITRRLPDKPAPPPQPTDASEPIG